MTIATLKDLIIGCENYDEELTNNIHSTIVVDRKKPEKKIYALKSKKEKLRIEEQKKNYALKNEREITLRTTEFKIDDENYSLSWHVVPADKLKFEAVIGSDLLEQASISFTKEGVKFNKYENHAQFMQISAENLQEQLDLRHVENRQIKKELEKFIQDYKPEKQHLLTSQ
ncbi:RVP domain-containing protein [Trichonephila clavipes]|nr:RVP domain-containing protein [Trichonephila clavipes]